LTREDAGRAEDDPEADNELQRLLRDLDAAMLPAGGDDAVDNLVWVSFVENASTESEEPLRNRLRSFSNLRRALAHYE
jgi:hypothetical protein